MMEMELKKGNLCVLKRPLADFLVIIQWIEEDDVAVRYMDSPRGEAYNVVKREELIKLAEEQEKELPQDFLSAVDRQRQIIFSPKKSQKSLSSLLRGISQDQEDRDQQEER
ncbi:MAG: hypothetical protein O8C67_08875 [Candidatus Methanoperedens sp.]|nr:hypothetical protein [Candidatus Methanoperedens sp.]